MIVSASRRTDIPACYAPWLARRLQEGYALVRHPHDRRILTRVPLTSDVVDGLVLWTKHAAPLLPYLGALDAFPYYVQYTVTPYGEALEPELPDVWQTRIPALRRLAESIGASRIVWRYDPIILTRTYTIEWHIAQFERMAAQLAPYCRKCTFSFVDLYDSTLRNMAGTGIRAILPDEIRRLAASFAGIAAHYGLSLDTCCEAIDLSAYGIGHAACVDRAILEKIGGYPLTVSAAKRQRSGCRCMQSTDIGAYGTCVNGCLYCYANADAASARRLHAQHDPASPLLFGIPEEGDIIRPMKAESYRDGQMRMF